MKTIAKNRTKKIQEIKDSALTCKRYALDNNFQGESVYVDGAFEALSFFGFAKLVQHSENKYNVNVHSNLWFVILTS